jgi:hypothetical protein
MWRTLYPWQAIRWSAEGDGGAPLSGDNSQKPGTTDGDGAGGIAVRFALPARSSRSGWSGSLVRRSASY